MPTLPFAKLSFWNSVLWGFSVALSWTWGLGLFFSVQIALQFGLAGLLFFAIPNAIGLMAFGWFTQHIARRYETGRDFERHFLTTVGNMRWMFLLYQVVAIALTCFALFMYVFVPLGVNPLLIAFVLLGAALLLGEQFDIQRIKWSHFAFSLIIALSILLIGWGGGLYFNSAGVPPAPMIEGHDPVVSWKFAGFLVPILCGFLLGPWLDIQQWQRAIQIRREKSNIRTAYNVGGLLFFGLLLFHGTLALAIVGEGARLDILDTLILPANDGLFHAKDAIIRFLFLADVPVPWLFQVMYVTFLCLCVVSTLDSGYVALKWFQKDAVSKSESVLVALMPKGMLDSPLPPFLLAAGMALLAVPLRFELEYFMAFYGSFSIGYSMVFLFRTTFEPRFTAFTQTTLVSYAAFSAGVFGLGYLYSLPVLMMIGAVLPLAHATAVILTRRAVEEISKSGVMERVADAAREAIEKHDIRGVVKKFTHDSREAAVEKAALEANAPIMVVSSPDPSPDVASIAGGGSCWIEGKWFVHTMTATYQDTNSVGNVYFAQYAMWVGKTRELFFNHCLPEFDLRTTPWYILTRMFEHKFLRESREFEQIRIKIRVSDFNRKFVTMEHQVFDSHNALLGKGKQVLLFVSSSSYQIIDIPADCHKAFIPYIA